MTLISDIFIAEVVECKHYVCQRCVLIQLCIICDSNHQSVMIQECKTCILNYVKSLNYKV